MKFKSQSWDENLKVSIPKNFKQPILPELNCKLINHKLHPLNELSMKKYADKFNNILLDAAEEYKFGNPYINANLRGHDPENIESYDYFDPDDTNKIVSNLKYITSHKLKAPQTMYRGNMMPNILPLNSKFTDKGFVSTSYGLETPIYFSKNNRLFAIHAPIGTKAYYIDNILDNPAILHEDEILLHPNTRFRVVGHSQHLGDLNKPTHITHVAIMNRPENSKWLDTIKNNHVNIVTKPNWWQNHKE